MQIEVIIGAIAQGLLWSVMAMGIYITYRILDFADLTAEGCFTLAASVVGSLVTKEFLNGIIYTKLSSNFGFIEGLFNFLSVPVVATIMAIFAGAMAGVVTGVLHTKLKIPALISGILTMTGLYSVNLRIMGKPSITMTDENFESISILRGFQKIEIKNSFLNNNFGAFIKDGHLTKNASAWIVGLIVIAIVIFVLWWFFNTEIGYALRATGSNEHMSSALGVDTDAMKILGLALGNGLVALGSALVSQYDDYVGINVGTGTIVFGLSSVIIGEVLVNKKNSIFLALIGVVLGSVVYRLVISFALSIGLSTNDLKLLTSLILGLTLSTPVIKNKIKQFLANGNRKKEFKERSKMKKNIRNQGRMD